MQRINITRTYRKDSYTIGKLYVNGSYVCNTLELHDSTYYGEDFVLGKSAIPVGVYTLATCVWSPKFNDFRPRITDFKYSKNILIHEGNKPEDTEGCILVGQCPTRVNSDGSTSSPTKRKVNSDGSTSSPTKRKVNSEAESDPDYDAGWIGQSKATLKGLRKKLSEHDTWKLIID